MATHTPGPWTSKRTHICSGDHWYVIVDANGRGPVIDVGGKDEIGQIAEAKWLITDPEIIEANARLIAAAPELLKACKDVLSFVRAAIGQAVRVEGFDWREHVDAKQLMAAIAKAEATP